MKEVKVDEAPPKISLASISCTQQNRNEEDVPQKETITQKDQIQQLTTKYIPPHLRKVDKIQFQEKKKENLQFHL
jgi:hypothetical protein